MQGLVMSRWPLAYLGRLALFGAVLCVLPLSDAFSASRVCRQIEAQLAAAPEGARRGSGQTRKYDQAIERQQNQMAIARDQARDAGCGFGVFGRKIRQCAGLNATIDRMERNLEDLQQARSRMGGSSAGPSRARLIAKYEANGCGDDSQEVAIRRPQADINEGPVRPSIIERIFGGNGDEKLGRVEDLDRQEIARADPDAGVPIERPRRIPEEPFLDEGPAPSRETYATSCVRTCDGYFFPMSPKSRQSDFARDKKNCEASCPGADMQVFYRPADAAEDSDMISASTGRLYSETETAFAYKEGAQSRPATCGCNVAKNFEVITKAPSVETPAAPASTPSQETAAVAPTAPVETAAPETPPEPAAPASPSFTTPDTLPVPGAIAPPASPVSDGKREIDRSANLIASQAASAADRKVRVVGPVFLPDPGAAIDLQAPAPKAVR